MVVGQDDTEAFKWAKRAADHEWIEAEVFVGQLYAQGRGVDRDDAEAVRWFAKTADDDYGLGQALLGYSYCSGKGVEVDFVKCLQWLYLADESDEPEAKAATSRIWPRVNNWITPEQTEAGRQAATAWRANHPK